MSGAGVLAISFILDTSCSRWERASVPVSASRTPSLRIALGRKKGVPGLFPLFRLPGSGVDSGVSGVGRSRFPGSPTSNLKLSA